MNAVARPASQRSQGSMSDLAKKLAGQASAGLDRVFGRRTPRPLGILVYHRVTPPIPGLPTPSMNVTPESFARQLSGLQSLDFRFLSLDEAIRRHHANEPIEPRSAIVTFDDGLASVGHFAWPTLRDLKIPATIFLNTAFLDSTEPMPFDRWGVQNAVAASPESYRSLTRDQCREMRASGLVELGTHTHRHHDFRGRADELTDDLRTSIETLERDFGIASPTFAFPFGRKALGNVSPELVEAARRAGVICALTTEAEPVDPRSDPFDWGRFNVYDWDTPRTLAAKLDGWYGWAPALQERWLARGARAGTS